MATFVSDVLSLATGGTRMFAGRRVALSGGMMPHLEAMERAVSMLSPVTIGTVMPARWQLRIARGTSGRSGSSMPTTARHVRPASTRSSSSQSGSSCVHCTFGPVASSLSSCREAVAEEVGQRDGP